LNAELEQTLCLVLLPPATRKGRRTARRFCDLVAPVDGKTHEGWHAELISHFEICLGDPMSLQQRTSQSGELSMRHPSKALPLVLIAAAALGPYGMDSRAANGYCSR
jgi:hypothetical protein